MLRNYFVKAQNNIKKFEVIRSLTSTKACNVVPESQKVDQNELQKIQIDEAIKATPSLAKVSPELWNSAHQTFSNHGLSTNNFLRIVTGNPKVLMRSPQKIIDTLEHWRACQFGEYFLFLLLTKYPFLMDVDDKRRLLKQMTFLQSYVSTHKNIWKLLMNCPTLVTEPQSSIEAKVLYLKNTMRIEIPEIVKSEVLGKSLEHIKYRHVFMDRLGLFKPRPIKADPDEKTSNPRLYKITDTSEKTFATKVCHVSFDEYEAFKELYARELKRADEKENLDNESDPLSDDEN